jgi:2,5-furandicarboxylate decarboxylase 1
MGLDHYVKLVVVDRDIDPRREADVWWAVATRMQADRDLNILRNMLVNRLDPSSDDGLGAKLILDATTPLDGQARRVSLPAEAEELARRLLQQSL